jgi:hypothetical protein
MDWLNAYTFPLETEYKDDAFAKHVYEKVVVSEKSYQNLGFGQHSINCSAELWMAAPQQLATLEQFTQAPARFSLIKHIKWVSER